MTDLARLGIVVTTDGVAVADRQLEGLANSADRAQRQTGHVGDAARYARGPVGGLSTAVARAGSALANGGIGGAAFSNSLFGIARSLALIGGPLTLVVGAAAALGWAWMEGEKSALSYERAVTGVGRTAGLTAARLEELARAGAEQGGISIKSAQEQANAYLATGRVGEQAISDLLRIGKDYASFMGVDAATATRELASAMSDPDKAAKEMTRTFGLLTQEQIKQVEAAMKAGDQMAAQEILLRSLDGAVAGHAENVSQITSAWDAVGRSISNAITKFGEWLYVTDTEKLAKMDRDIGRVRRGEAAGDLGTMTARRDALRESIQRPQDEAAARARDAAANQRAQIAADSADPAARAARTARGGQSDAEREYERLIRQSEGMIEAMERERREMGLTEAQIVRLNAARQARDLVATGTSGGVQLAGQVIDEAERLIAAMADFNLIQPVATNLTPLSLVVPDMISNVELLADELRMIDTLARDAAGGMASAFGEAGRAMGELLTTMTGYQSRLAEINLAQKEGQISAMQADRERASAQVQSYGDMLGAAKGFFKEGSDGYKVLQAAEQAYRAVQFAMAVQAMILDTQQTGVSVGNSLTRGAASAAAGAAKMFEMLGPFAFPVVAGMIALLAALGLRGGGGGGSGGGGAYNPAPINSREESIATARGQVSASQGAAATSTQRLDVRVTSEDRKFRAWVVQETAPRMNAVGAAAVQTSRAAVPADRSRSEAFKMGGRGR